MYVLNNLRLYASMLKEGLGIQVGDWKLDNQSLFPIPYSLALLLVWLLKLLGFKYEPINKLKANL